MGRPLRALPINLKLLLSTTTGIATAGAFAAIGLWCVLSIGLEHAERASQPNPEVAVSVDSFAGSRTVSDLYDGIGVLDNRGNATVELPDDVLALNTDFYFLTTAIGTPMPNLHIVGTVHRRYFNLFGAPVFDIQGGAPNGKVSWQVTGVRHDPFIEDHPIVPEVDKGGTQPYQKGQYQCPECYASSSSR